MSIIENSLFDPIRRETPDSRVKIAKIVSVSDEGAAVQFDNEESPGTKKYKVLRGYTPSVSDRVVMLGISGSYIILGAF